MGGVMWEVGGGRGVKGMSDERNEYCMYVLLSPSYTKIRGKINKKSHYNNRSQTY